MPPKSEEATSPQQLVREKDRSGEKAEFASAAYNRVARSAKLEGILLTASKFEISPDFFISTNDEKGPKLGYGALAKNFVFDHTTGITSCDWAWTVTGRVKRKKALTLEAVYQVLYDGLIGCDPVAVERFMRRVGRFASYPYFRAHVSQLSWESGANLPILPNIAT